MKPEHQALYQLIRENPGIGTSRLRRLMAERHPEYTMQRRNPGNVPRIVNGGNSRNARWYTEAAWVAHNRGSAPTTTAAAPTKQPWAPGKVEPARSDATAAFSIPSRRGDQFDSYTGPKPMCVGPGSATGFAAGRMMGKTT